MVTHSQMVSPSLMGGIQLAPESAAPVRACFGSSPELSTSRSLPQQRCVLHWRRTFSFTAQWKTKTSRPGKEKGLRKALWGFTALILKKAAHLADC